MCEKETEISAISETAAVRPEHDTTRDLFVWCEEGACQDNPADSFFLLFCCLLISYQCVLIKQNYLVNRKYCLCSVISVYMVKKMQGFCYWYLVMYQPKGGESAAWILSC